MAKISLPAGRPQHMVMLPMTQFWSQNRHCFDGNSLHHLVWRYQWTSKAAFTRSNFCKPVYV